MLTRLKFYFGCVAAAAAIFTLSLDWQQLSNLSIRDWGGLITFLLLAVLSQAMAVESTVGASKPVTSSTAFLPLMALAVVMPVPAVVFATGSMTLVNELLVSKKRSWGKVVFNTSQAILSLGLGAVVFQTIDGIGGAVAQLDGAAKIANLFLPFFGLAATFFILNMVLVSVVIAIRENEDFVEVLTEAAGRGGGNLFYDLLASPMALFAAYLYETLYIGGLLAFVLPLLLIRHSYLSAIQLQQVNKDLLRVLIKAIETRDPYTSGHSLRVSTLARLIAQDHGLRLSTVYQVETAALLHDIGKIDALYAEIISKPTALTDDERDIIQTHATTGADLLETLTSLEKTIVEGVRHHHEQYDGSGYPSGLAGKAIPIAARIIMICDAVDAMLSDRPYRDALSVTAVREELRRCAGTQFDPALVETILRSGTLERAELLADRSGARARLRAAVS